MQDDVAQDGAAARSGTGTPARRRGRPVRGRKERSIGQCVHTCEALGGSPALGGGRFGLGRSFQVL